jgi:hypothetical protein
MLSSFLCFNLLKINDKKEVLTVILCRRFLCYSEHKIKAQEGGISWALCGVLRHLNFKFYVITLRQLSKP